MQSSLPPASIPSHSGQPNYLRMLAVLASPIANAAGDRPPEHPTLDGEGEWERLCQAAKTIIDPVNNSTAPWAIVRLDPPNVEKLELVLNSGEYQILHVCAHGNARGVILEDNTCCENLLTIDYFVQIIKGSSIKLVVLNVCQSYEIGRALYEQAKIPNVIAIRDDIYDPEAKLFCKVFYTSLSHKMAINAAFDSARKQVKNELDRHQLQGVPGTSEQRYNNFYLFGNGDDSMEIAEPKARTPILINYKIAHNGYLPISKLTNFVGYTQQFHKIRTWALDTGKLAYAITGDTGIGKTILALYAALRCRERFNLVYIDIKKVGRSPLFETILRVINSLIPCQPTGNQDVDRISIIDCLNSSNILLVLDGLEQVPDNDLQVLKEILDSIDTSSGSRVILVQQRLHKFFDTLVPYQQMLHLDGVERAASMCIVYNMFYRSSLKISEANVKPKGTHVNDYLRNTCEQFGILKSLTVKDLELLYHIADLMKDSPGLINKLFDNISSLDDLIAKIFTEELKDILKDIQIDENVLLDIYRATLPIGQFNNSIHTGIAICDMIEHLADFSNNGPVTYLHRFAQELIKKISDKDKWDRLDNWLKPYNISISPIVIDHLNAIHLLIIIKPSSDGLENSYDIDSYLSSLDNNMNLDYRTRISDTKFTNINPDNFQTAIERYVHVAEQVLFSKKDLIEVFVEIFTPYNLIFHPFDCYEMTSGITLKERIGVRKSLVVRAWERISPKFDFQFSQPWLKNWRHLEGMKNGALRRKTKKLKSTNDIAAFAKSPLNQNYFCVNSAYAPNQAISNQFAERILIEGISLMICNQFTQDDDVNIASAFNLPTSFDPDVISRHVRSHRQKLAEKGSQFGYTLFLDNPNRIPNIANKNTSASEQLFNSDFEEMQ